MNILKLLSRRPRPAVDDVKGAIRKQLRRRVGDVVLNIALARGAEWVRRGRDRDFAIRMAVSWALQADQPEWASNPEVRHVTG